MRPETKLRLDALVWKQRARLALLAILVVGALAGLFVYYATSSPDAVIETRTVPGVVTYWTRTQEYGIGRLVIRVKLDDGREIAVTDPSDDAPRRGRAEIEERRHESGRISYVWLRSKPD